MYRFFQCKQQLTSISFAIITIASVKHSIAAGRTIAVWIRDSGNYGSIAPKKKRIKIFPLKALPLRERTITDYQYGKGLKYRGLFVDELLKRYSGSRHFDLALLHFKNGMTVPLPRAGRAAKHTPPVFIAVFVWSEKRKIWTTRFPKVSKLSSRYKDVRPVRFVGNKVVVSGGDHPMVPQRAIASVNPWRHVDSLVGIELASSDAYYRQFDISDDAPAKKGLVLFRENCQFCHGIRRVGASFGWDFVTPQPIYEYRDSPKKLYYHIKYQRSDASELGLMMPAIKHMAKQDAQALWFWLKAIATKPLRDYRPPQNIQKL